MGHNVSREFNSTVGGADTIAVTAMESGSASSTDNARQSNIVQGKVDNIVQTNPVEHAVGSHSTFDLGAARKRLKQLREHVDPKVSQQVDDSNVLPGRMDKSKFAGRSINDLLVVEIFAGSARLTKACRGLGMRAVAVDKTQDRSEGSHIFQCDVTNESDRQSLVAFLEAERGNLGWVHFAPACGTASKAREREQPGLERKGFSLPKPLRSELHPLGLPGLTGVDKLRTETWYTKFAHNLSRCSCNGVYVALSKTQPTHFFGVFRVLRSWSLTLVAMTASSTIVAMGDKGKRVRDFGALNHGFRLLLPNVLEVQSIFISRGSPKSSMVNWFIPLPRRRRTHIYSVLV